MYACGKWLTHFLACFEQTRVESHRRISRTSDCLSHEASVAAIFLLGLATLFSLLLFLGVCARQETDSAECGRSLRTGPELEEDAQNGYTSGYFIEPEKANMQMSDGTCLFSFFFQEKLMQVQFEYLAV